MSQKAEIRIIRDKVQKLADQIRGLDNGSHAEIRRGQINGELWVLLSSIDEAKDDVGPWHIVVQCIAIAGQNDVPFGLALRDIGLSDARITRLLDAKPEAVPDMLLRIARRMTSQDVSADWTFAYRLMVTPDNDPRYHIARKYYTN